jgi:hypothetical protein
MGSAVNSLMGGGGSGGIFGALGGIIGGIFGGPIGAMIGQAVGNMLQEAVGEGLSRAVDTLQKEDGMPKFLADQVKDSIPGVLDSIRNGGVDSDVQQGVNDKTAGWKDAFAQDFANEVVNTVRRERSEEGGEGGSGGGGWLQAIAKAMGKTLGEKAAKMVELSDKMSELQGGGGDDKENAKEFNMTMTQFQATSQEYSLLNNAFTTAIKALGEALSNMARKQ